MKYIKKFEDVDISDSKFKKGDYVMSTINSRRGFIYDISYSKLHKGIVCSIEGDRKEDFNFMEEYLRLMTPEEIELFKISNLSYKFNI